MPSTRGTRIALIAGAALAVAAMTACGAQPDKAAAPATPDTPATSAPASPSISPSTTPSAEPPGAQPVAQEPAAKKPAPKKFLDMRTVDVLKGAAVTLPARNNGVCAAATIRFDRNGVATVKGVTYQLYGEGNLAYGDLNRDGRTDLTLIVDCGNGPRKQLIVTLGATGPTTYETIASGPALGKHAEQTTVRDDTLTTYDVHWPKSAATEVREYQIRERGIFQMNGPTAG